MLPTLGRRTLVVGVGLLAIFLTLGGRYEDVSDTHGGDSATVERFIRPQTDPDDTPRRGGPTVLITGSNRGIGLAFAREYAEEGWNVIATARSPEAAEALQALAAETRWS